MSAKLAAAALVAAAVFVLFGCAEESPRTQQQVAAAEDNFEQALPEVSQHVQQGPELSVGKQDQQSQKECSAHSNAGDISRLIRLLMLEIEMLVAEDLIAQHLNAIEADAAVAPSPALALSMERLFVLPTGLEHEFPHVDASIKSQLRQLGEDLYELNSHWLTALGLWEETTTKTNQDSWPNIQIEIQRIRSDLRTTLELLSGACATVTLNSMQAASTDVFWQLLVTNSSLGYALGASCLVIDCYGGGDLWRIGDEHPLVQWLGHHLVRLHSEIRVLLNHSSDIVFAGSDKLVGPAGHDLATADRVRRVLFDQWLVGLDLSMHVSQLTVPLDLYAVAGSVSLYGIAVARSWDSVVESGGGHAEAGQ